MKNILPALFLLACFTTTKAQSSYLAEFKQKWDNAKNYTLEIAQIMPEEYYDFKPSEEQMTFREQLLHILGNMRWLSSSYLGGKRLDVDLKKTDYSKAEILDLLRKGFDQAGKAIEELDEETLNEEVSFFAGPMTKRQILTLMNDHLTHHRGQAIVYVRLKKLEPPSYRGW